MLRSFLPVAPESHFPLNNLPYGVFSTRGDPSPRPGVALGDSVVDLRTLSRAGLLRGPALAAAPGCFEAPTLNAFMGAGRAAWAEARAALLALLAAEGGDGALRENAALRAEAIVPQSKVTMHLPAAVGDFTDFYASLEHATNCGRLFGRGDEPLHPNWCRLPVAYHGRASSILPSGTAVRRPWGQTAPPDPASPPGFAPSAKIDFELEMGAFVGPGNALGDPIPVENALDHVFGLVLLNDWSARDVQAWEYVPLGPFLSKSWATTISPWVVTLEALAPWAVPAPAQAPPPLPYLAPRPGAAFSNYSVQLEAAIRPAGGGGGSTVSGAGSGGAGSVSAPGGSGNAESGLSSSPPPTVVARSGLASLYWALPQLVAHHAAGGCNLRPGDLLGTGTLSRGGAGGRGCLLEATKGGAAPLQLAAEGGAGFVERTYLEDGDEVVLTGWCAGDGFRVGFGECGGRLLPARSPPA